MRDLTLIIERFQALSTTQLVILAVFVAVVMFALGLLFSKLGIKSASHTGDGGSSDGGGCD